MNEVRKRTCENATTPASRRRSASTSRSSVTFRLPPADTTCSSKPRSCCARYRWTIEGKSAAEQTIFRRRPSRTQAREGDHLGGRDVVVHADRAGRRTDHRAHAVADLEGHLPPPVLPGAHAAGGPCLGVLGQRRGGAARHRAQRVADHVGGAGEDRELGAPAREVVSERPAWAECIIQDSDLARASGSAPRLGAPQRQVTNQKIIK